MPTPNRLVFGIYRTPNGRLQAQLAQLDADDNGHGYRLAGPKFLGDSSALIEEPLTERDAREIRAMLDAVFPPPADRAALRDRIADTLAAADGWSWVETFDKTRSSTYRSYQSRADAVLAVLPAPTDRAAVLAEAYEIAYAEGMRLNALEAEIGVGPYRGALAVAHLLRKAISEAQQVRRLADEVKP